VDTNCNAENNDDTNLWKFSALNELDSDNINTSLSKLSQVEKMLIARVHTYVKLRQI